MRCHVLAKRMLRFRFGASIMQEPKTVQDIEKLVDAPSKQSAKQRIHFVLRFVAQPLMFFAAGLVLLAVLGLAQRTGWISAGGSADRTGKVESGLSAVDHICPMMCTPPQKEPGRCPVCAMELVPASTGGGGDERSIFVDAASR